MQLNAAPTLVKRYGRSRLYDTEAMRYVTLVELRAWQARGVPFVVLDTETGGDVTRLLLAKTRKDRLM